MLYQSNYYLPFLMASLGLYWLVLRTPAQRTLFLSAASVAFLVLFCMSRQGLETTVLQIGGMLLFSLAVHAWGARLRRSKSGPDMWLGILVCLLPLAGYKYLLPTLGAGSVLPAWAIPLGISYYTFKHIHYLVESYRGKFGDARLAEYFAYICFFPMFAAGPIERFDPFRQQLGDLHWRSADMSQGLERILFGALKKFLVADLLLDALMPPVEMGVDSLSSQPVGVALFACMVKFIQTYFDFSGYTDMALGTARLFGIRLMENFNYPLLRSNLAEFWRAWHMSLSSFARDYVYFPIMGRWRLPAPALMATMLSIGLWHSGAVGWVLWGMHHGLGLVLLARFHHAAPRYHRLQRVRASLPWRIGATAATLVYVSLGYALTFYPSTAASSLQMYLHIVSFGVLS
ncbi:MBOAT family O-acyltransferase [Massilia niastensis]|uniref:MBOAT family O-acyltransferase n=1 Tax=Massilia niastensis TaxID=544911 RepID=UPI0003697020|nr:MBOAT family O-acyltransferase [Massilia niastensis]